MCVYVAYIYIYIYIYIYTYTYVYIEYTYLCLVKCMRVITSIKNASVYSVTRTIDIRSINIY